MDEDPFSALCTTLQAVFAHETQRNEKYFYPAVQKLKEAIDSYDQKGNTFIKLRDAMGNSSSSYRKMAS